ncbi:MAG: M64 family metallopeptidase [Planctomycetota bacterium]
MLTSLCLALASVAAADFDALFTGRALRFDYFHVGSATEEHVCIDRYRIEGEWPGSRTRLVDDTNFGKYRLRVVDRASGRTVYSRGFASIYGEWETTGEAKTSWKSFHESQRMPEPKAPVRLVLEKRWADGTFGPFYETDLDPASRFVDRSPVTQRGTAAVLFENGPAHAQVDLLVLADGYTAAEQAKFDQDAARLVGVMFDTEPYKSRRADFSVRTLFVPAAQSGISNPRKDVWRDAPLGSSFNAFDVDRYVLTFANATLREVAAQVPYDALVILFHSRKYGGGGIYNLWATVASDSAASPYLFVHEFGHSFAGLADEYYTSQVAYESFTTPGVEPWEPNVTALADPARLKWKDLVAVGTPLPTPWGQEAYDKLDVAYQKKRKELVDAKAPEEASEALFREIHATTAPLLAAEKHNGKVGAFEGAAYEAKGLYRSEVDCIMFTRNPTSFCRVCRRAVERVIDLYTR